MPNRLAAERSPYLLQHADNPVDWYAWGDEAFASARREDKPIFLSIGYSTCHWCHVMAHESFESPLVADALNRYFISIKLDREERPDVDRVYMMFVQATTGAGGWPMSVWLTPDRQPFFGGTYFPPTPRWGRPGFFDVVEQLGKAWREERQELLDTAADVVERLRAATGGAGRAAEAVADGRPALAGVPSLSAGIAAFASTFDPRHGGFGGAPKFPRPAELLFLLQARALTDDWQARTMALETLRSIARGGIRDQIGGGFHRYSVDAEWRVPHFEKMLYDQAQLVLAYLEAAQASGEALFAEVAEDTLRYVQRDLTAPDGAFFSAEDADSEIAGDPGEKREGAFYVWTAEEVAHIADGDADVVMRRFGVVPEGNALADPQGEFRGQNILYIAQSVEDIAARTGRSAAEVTAALEQTRRALFEVRAARPAPHLDDKVLTSWNGLMIAAFARAARQLVDSPRREEWQGAAVRAATALRAHLWREADGRLLRRYRDGDAAIDGLCEDYAYLTWGLLELFQATGDGLWLRWARQLTEIQTDLFHDETDGGWFSTTGDDPTVLLRMKEDYDGAEPAAASVTVRNLITLGHLTADTSMLDLARRTLERYGTELGQAVRVMPLMAGNIALWHGGGTQVVIAGPAGHPDTQAFKRVVTARHLPWLVTVPIESSHQAEALGADLPWVRTMVPRADAPVVYLCHDFVCQAPIGNVAELEAALDGISRASRLTR